MNNLDALRISEQRDDICEWVVERFRELIAEDRNDDAIAFADEWFEWLDPENHESEETLYTDYDELRTTFDL
jgi:hypothetical protein